MIYREMPVYIRWIFLPLKLIVKSIRKVFNFIDTIKLDLWIIAGEEASTKEELAVIYAGREKNKNYIAKLAFNGLYNERFISKIWVWKIKSEAKRKDRDCPLLVVEAPKFCRRLFQKENFFYIPSWISGEVDIFADISLICKDGSLKSDLRRIRRNKLAFEVSNNLSQFKEFYFDMYLPYITNSHGDRAIVTGYDSMKEKFKECDLFLVKNGVEFISGGLIAYDKNKVSLWHAGVRDGARDYINDGAVAALYYFSVLYLKERGYKKLNFGMSRPFLKDGVLQYKRKWKIRIIKSPEAGIFIKPLVQTGGVKGFFLNNPFIYLDKENLKAALFIEEGKILSKEDFEKIYKDYSLKGLSKLMVYRFGENFGKCKDDIPPEFKDRVAVCPTKGLF